MLHGIECPQTQYYVENRSEVLRYLSDLTGSESNNVKLALLALLYGASIRSPKSIERLLYDGVGEFCNDVEIISLSNEINKVASEIIDSAATTQNGFIKNVIGKSLNPMGLRWPQKLTHLLQGYEAKAMHIAIEEFPDEVALLMHDGYVFKSRVDMSLVSGRLSDEDGIQVDYSKEKL